MRLVESSRIWTHVYYRYQDTLPSDLKDVVQNSNILGTTKTNVQPVQAVVITWENMAPISSSANATDEMMTFQLILVTNSTHTYALYLYGDSTWKRERNRGRLAAMVYQCNKQRYYQHPRSNTVDIYSRIHGVGNTGVVGLYGFLLGTCPANYNNAEHSCYKWRDTENSNFLTRFKLLILDIFMPKCPCNLVQMSRDVRFMSFNDDCFVTRFTFVFFGGTRTCCYNGNRLVTRLPGAGFLHLFHPFWDRTSYRTYDYKPYQNCCVRSNLCNVFSGIRHVDTCAGYRPPRRSIMRGDPHITTLDGLDYTYNGLGEFVMIQAEDSDKGLELFEVQARTQTLTNTNGTTVDATIFSAFAGADFESNATFMVEIDNNKAGFIVFGNGVDATRSLYGKTGSFSQSNLFMKLNATLEISFQNQISLTIGIARQMLNLELKVPEPYKVNKTIRGLLGDLDGNPENDFVLPDGTVLLSNMSESEIYYQFGEKWRTTEDKSLFAYSNNKTHASYQDPTFTPLFIDSFSESERSQANVTCKSDVTCIYDYLATNDSDIAQNTLTINEDLKENIKTDSNEAPHVNASGSVIKAKINEAVNLTITAKDDGTGPLTVHISGIDDRSSESTDGGSVQMDITWTPGSLEPVNASAYAVDDVGLFSSILYVPIQLCGGCDTNNGLCDYSEDIGTGVLFTIVPCTCNNGWEGENCTTNTDGCSDDPCPTLAVCKDRSPAQEAINDVAYTCSDCPAGYQLNDENTLCLDVDECSDTTLNKCNQDCTNIVGSYTCNCNQGYRLNDKTCTDIDECREGTDVCQQLCGNNDGSYTCQCQTGYTLNDDSLTCSQVATVETNCSVLECAQGCNGLSCFCLKGFRLNYDGQTCDDINECGTGVCPQYCTNSEGGFQCFCYDGYRLSTDKISCVECDAETWGPNCATACDCSQFSTRCDPLSGCVCQPGWRGALCDVDIDECANDFACTQLQDCINMDGSFSCQCKDGYQSQNGICVNINECEINEATDCSDIQTCSDLTPGYRCNCIQGYQEVDGQCSDVDECSGTNPCRQDCINTIGFFNCKCFLGYELNLDRLSCNLSSDPCAGSDVTFDTCTAAGAAGCKVANDVASCFCDLGYILQTNNSCIDINECLVNSPPCTQTCNNTAGGYLCSCEAGYKLTLDGSTCQPCNETGQYGGSCENTCTCGAGSLYCDSLSGCQCKSGWTGTNCDNDIQDCDDKSKCLNNQTCTERPGSYTCGCTDGYTVVNDVCIDINECTTGSHTCSQRCTNTPGSFSCSCRQGFQLVSGSSTACENINECQTGVTECEQTCIDTKGSYLCSCSPGFTINPDQRTCDLDKVNDPCSNFTVSCEYGCTLTNGNTPTCFCQTDYKLSENGKNCTALQNKIRAVLRLDIPYLSVYDDVTSQEFRDVSSDLREALESLYRNASLGNFQSVRIDAITSDFDIHHTVVFSLDNVTEEESTGVAKALQQVRQGNQVTVAGTLRHVTSEPSIQLTGQPAEKVSCALCTSDETCILETVMTDTYQCVTPSDPATSVGIIIKLVFIFTTKLSIKTSPEYSQLKFSIETSLTELFSSIAGYSGIGIIDIQNGSIVVLTTIKFNQTTTEDNVKDVAKAMTTLDDSGCMYIEEQCTSLSETSAVVQLNATITPSPCVLCNATTEECNYSNTTTRYTCTSKQVQVTPTDNTGLILGLGVGVPIGLMLILVAIVIACYRLKQKRRSGNLKHLSLDSSQSDPYRVQPAFGSVGSSLSGRSRPMFGNLGSALGGQYLQNWERTGKYVDQSSSDFSSSEERTTQNRGRPRPGDGHRDDDTFPDYSRHEGQQRKDPTSKFSWDTLLNDPQTFHIRRPKIHRHPDKLFLDEEDT